MKKPSAEQLLADTQSSMTWSQIAEKYGYTDARFLRKLSVRYGLPPRRVILKPDKSTLEEMIITCGLNIYQVADALGYSAGGWSNIYAYCREYGITFDFSANAELRKVEFSLQQKSFVYGTLLGDSYLRPSGNSYSLSMTHSQKQVEYLKWKMSMAAPFIVADTYSERMNIAPHGKPCRIVSINTIAHPFLSSVRSECYPGGKKTVSKNWLNQVDELALAVWFMDDGSRNKTYKTLTLCTNGFSREEHLLMQDWFLGRYKIPTVIENRRNGQFSLRINASVSSRFLELVRPFIPSCMSYKLGE